jgi:hypothetical protein
MGNGQAWSQTRSRVRRDDERSSTKKDVVSKKEGRTKRRRKGRSQPANDAPVPECHAAIYMEQVVERTDLTGTVVVMFRR